MFEPSVIWTFVILGVGAVLMVLFLTIGAFFLGFEAGRRAALGLPQGLFGPGKGSVSQALEETGSHGNPLQALDEVIGRALGDMHRPQGAKRPNLIDPELAGLAPTQARTGGDL